MSEVGCSGDGGVGLSLLGPVPVFGSLSMILPVGAASGVHLAV